MKRTFYALTLTFALASPFTSALAVYAQPRQPAVVECVPSAPEFEAPSLLSQTESEAVDAFFNSKFNYYDAKMLAHFWGTGLGETKAIMGRKILFAPENKAYLEQMLVDARLKALARAENLDLFFDAGFDYRDAEALAGFWGESSPWEAKVRVERNLILGNEPVVRAALRMAREERH